MPLEPAQIQPPQPELDEPGRVIFTVRGTAPFSDGHHWAATACGLIGTGVSEADALEALTALLRAETAEPDDTLPLGALPHA